MSATKFSPASNVIGRTKTYREEGKNPFTSKRSKGNTTNHKENEMKKKLKQNEANTQFVQQ